MKAKYTILSLMGAAMLLSGSQTLSAQKPSKKVQTVEISAKVVDETGAPVKGAVITAGEGAITRYTDAEGRFAISSKADAVILVEATGYKDLVVDLRVNRNPKSITLSSEPYLSGEKDTYERPDGGYTSRHDLTAAVGSVDADILRHYPDLNLSNAFQGQIPGLVVTMGNSGLGNATSSFFVRGQHATGTQAIVVVDGIERSLDDMAPEEIGTIEVLKDAAAKVLYGARGTNGVVLITTKRGEANKRIIRTSVEYGVTPTTRVPKFLGVNDYVSLFNEARENDGLAPYYSDEQIAGYANSTGVNDLYYPSVDWYKEFTKNMGTFRKASAEFNGGNQSVRYALTTTYTGGTGLEAQGPVSELNRFNVRGNLDITINDFLTACADVGARLETRSWGSMNAAGIYGAISTLRPNEYPFVINPEDIGMEADESGNLIFGASIKNNNNIYMALNYGGDSSERYITSQSTFGLKFDFDKYVKGLFADAFISFDNYNFVSQNLSKNYATYAVVPYTDALGQTQYRIDNVKKISLSDDINVGSESTKSNLGFRVDGGYKRTFGRNSFSAIGAYRFYREEVLGANQNIVVSNTTLRLNWNFDQRYYVEATAGLAGSNQFASNHRYHFTPVVSAGWILSNEDFLMNSSSVNFLKLKASAGHLAYSPSNNYLLYKTAWTNGGTYALGQTNNSSVYYTTLSRIGNPDIDWITSDEFNVGIEGSFLGNRLQGEANLFHETRRGMINNASASYSSLIGQYLYSVNQSDCANRGAELGISWTDASATGDFRYTVGLNFTYSKNKILKTNELENMEDYRKSIGNSTSSVYGLKSLGLFKTEEDIAASPKQYYGYYTVGDVKYDDLNKDGIIDDKDQTLLGQSFPLTDWGLTVDLKYKGWGLYIHGTAQTGASFIQSNSYWWNTETDAYSVKALEAYHPTRNPNGTLPRLTTTTGTNSYRDSDFWLTKADFFRLKNAEISYTIENRKPTGLFKECKIFARGTNLFVLTGVEDLDPECPDAGVTNYPVMRTITGGLTVSF